MTTTTTETQAHSAAWLALKEKAKPGNTVKAIAAGRKEIVMISPTHLAIKPGENTRVMDSKETQDHIAELKESIRQHGFLPEHPISFFKEKDQFYVHSGHCRFTAVKELVDEGHPIEAIPAFYSERAGNEVARLVDQVITNSGKPFSMLDIGGVFARMEGLGLGRDDIAARMRKTRSYVDQAIALINGPQAVVTEVKAGTIAGSTAASVMADVGRDAAPAVIKEAVAIAAARGGKKAGKATEATVMEAVKRLGVPSKKAGTAPTRRKKTEAAAANPAPVSDRKEELTPSAYKRLVKQVLDLLETKPGKKADHTEGKFEVENSILNKLIEETGLAA